MQNMIFYLECARKVKSKETALARFVNKQS